MSRKAQTDDPLSAVAVRAAAATRVLREDLKQIVELALADLRNLHKGNISRYRLRLSEYRAWQPLQHAQFASKLAPTGTTSPSRSVL